MEIHTPKLISVASEGGANVFNVDFFSNTANLAQSPQLYKQMTINSDFGRVFEIGPVFRAENSFTHRHLCEFVGVDIEMELYEDYHQLTNFIWNLLSYVMKKLNKKCKQELETISQHSPFEGIIFPEEPIYVSFVEATKMLNKAGYPQSPLEDISTTNEKQLGKLIYEKYNSNMFILEEFPYKERPFYTMQSEKDVDYSKGFDIILRGEEIISGAQREHNYDKLICELKARNIDPESLKDYLESFKYGAKPHGGCGLGLERFVMLFLGLDNIRKTSLFPRDPKRITP
jgi:aspartyl-tRNA synthetase